MGKNKSKVNTIKCYTGGHIAPRKKRKMESGGQVTSVGQSVTGQQQNLNDLSNPTSSTNLGSLGSGALSGAAAGSSFGPVGMGVGAGIGFGTSILQINNQKKALEDQIQAQKMSNMKVGLNAVHSGNLEDAKINTEMGTLNFTPNEGSFQGIGQEVVQVEEPNKFGVKDYLKTGLVGTYLNNKKYGGKVQKLQNGGQVVAKNESEQGVDNIPMAAGVDAFVVPAENADIALQLRREYFPDTIGNKAPRKDGNVPI